MFHPFDDDLTPMDKLKALVSTVGLGIITFGIV